MRTIPLPLVRFQQSTMIAVLALAYLLKQPWIVAGLFAVLAVGVIGGPKANVIFAVGRLLLKPLLTGASQEDAAAQRFNQILALSMLGVSALLLLVFQSELWGWLFSGMVVAAASLALTGFCIGCVLYLRLRFVRQRLFGSRAA